MQHETIFNSTYLSEKVEKQKSLRKLRLLSGSEGRIRTNDTRIMIPLL